MIVLRSPKGWTGPKVVDGLQVEGTFRSHQVPLLVDADHPDHVALLESWMKSYRPEELFDEDGRLLPELAELAPDGRPADGCQPARQRRHAAARPADAGLPRPRRRRAVAGRGQRARTPWCWASSSATWSRSTRSSGTSGSSAPTRRSRTCSARSSRRPTVSGTPGRRRTTSSSRPTDACVDSMLSEHQCEGWLEGYLLTGRHGLFNCYEAFIHIVDSMFNQHAKWLKVTSQLPWRRRDRLAELPARLARLAAGPQRLHPPGPRLPRPRGQQEGRHRPGVPAARRQLPAVGRRSLPAQPATTSTSSSRGSTPCRSG